MTRRAALSITTIFITCFFGLTLVSCNMIGGDDTSVNDGSDVNATSYISPYDFSNLQWGEDLRFTYYAENTLASRTGIDVSKHNKSIDWKEVADDNIDFAFIRLGYRGTSEGKLNIDEFYDYNIERVKAVGIDTGVYFFSQALNAEEALEEAEFVLDKLDGIELEYPVVFDHEPLPELDGRADNISTEELSAAARAFCERIEQAGYETMIYGNKNDVARFDNSVVEDYDFWLAEYNDTAPTGQFDFKIWQYTESGEVNGISTAVDLNIEFIVTLDGQ